MNFKTYFLLDESIKNKMKVLGLAGLAAISPVTLDANVKNIPIAVTRQVDNSFIKRAANFIENNEGKRNKLYKDHRGNWTIGIGHLVMPSELNLYTGKTLSEEEILQLFNRDINTKMLSINRRFGDIYNTYSDDLKIAILDGFFRGDLSGSPKTINLLKQRKFKEAASEYLDNNEYRQSKRDRTGVYKRMETNARIMYNES